MTKLNYDKMEETIIDFIILKQSQNWLGKLISKTIKKEEFERSYYTSDHYAS